MIVNLSETEKKTQYLQVLMMMLEPTAFRWSHVCSTLSARDLYPTLANPTVPIAVQSMMIKAVISPCATYGGEVFGMNVAGLCPIRILLASTHEPSIKPSPSLIYESLSRSTGLFTLEHASS